MSEKLVLIDGHSILNRAFFGLPDLTNAQGIHTNAVYGFLNILFKILEEEKPDYLTVAFDLHAPTFRHKMFEAYKGTRKPMAEELRQQVPLMKEMLTAMGIRIIQQEGYEADDILGTLAGMGEERGMEVSVVSGDRDLLQLATEHVLIRIPKTKKTGTEIENYYACDVQERYHVTPKEFIDVKALMGDTADNIPGVPGIGEKTAMALIGQYGSIEEVHAHADEVKPPRASKNIVEYWEQAVLSKTLATIDTHVPLDYDFSEAHIESISALYTREAYLLCKQLEFKNLLSRFSVDAPKCNAQDFFRCIKSQKDADEIWEKASRKKIAFSVIPAVEEKKDVQMSLFEEPRERIAGMTLAFGEEDIYFFVTGEGICGSYLKQRLEAHAKQLYQMKANNTLSEDDFGLYTPDIKNALSYFDILGEQEPCEYFDEYQNGRSCYFDVTIASYLLNPLKGEYPYEDIAKDFLGLMIPSKQDLIGKKSVAEMLVEDESKAISAACYEIYICYKAMPVLWKELKEKDMDRLFRELEMPVAFVLSDMEKAGISMDSDALRVYGEELSVSIAALEQKIYELAGEEFNINSPKQLGVILFEKLGLPNGKKTKTGYSTSADVLEKLAGEYPIVADILEYRQLAKLKSTYADGLLQCVDENGKIHTTFNQTVTATGRLSSTDPNLQNIPIRIEMGKRIRTVFHAMPGYLFVDSDYSQIELRVLAHMSGDEKLIEAYRNHQDIHRTTASEVFHTPFDEVTELQRRNAKAVNFGIVYGISAFGLSQDLNISRKEAQEYIDSYFETYPKIQSFLETTVADAKENGYIKTLFGRIRPVPELSSSNFMQRQFGERVAMNSPIQGTAADIIKIAMVRVHDRLLREKLKSKLILQVHDELLIETAQEEEDIVIRLLEEEMKGACSLSVEMEVGTETGHTWYEAH